MFAPMGSDRKTHRSSRALGAAQHAPSARGVPRRPGGHPVGMTSSAGAPSQYVALGDSISIDIYAGGPGRGGASLLARNRDRDFPD